MPPQVKALLDNPQHIVDSLVRLKPASAMSLAFAVEIARTPGATGALGVWIPPDVNHPLDLSFLTAPKALMPTNVFPS